MPQEIIQIYEPNKEYERKYIDASRDPDAAREKFHIILDHMRDNPHIFEQTDDTGLIDRLPPGVASLIESPKSITPLRQRLYFFDSGLEVAREAIEVRQELYKRYGVKQTIKTGNGAKEESPTLLRMEYQAKLTEPGVNFDAVGDQERSRWLANHFNPTSLHPALWVVSQREKMTYHPDGDRDIVIEIAFDKINFFTLFTGSCWEKPLMEIEIKKGPKGRENKEILLDREERRFAEFGLIRDLKSNPAMAYPALDEILHSKRDRKRFERLNVNDKWWENQDFQALKAG